VMLFDRDPEETARIIAREAASISLEDKIHALFGPLAARVASDEPVVA
jgi:hypothetical protein